jgi:hypothetical protein
MNAPSFVYLLCLATCIACTVLLIRSWLRSRTPLLMWMAISLVFLALNNLLVVIDLLLIPDVDLTMWRLLAALAAGVILIVGFVWETE